MARLNLIILIIVAIYACETSDKQTTTPLARVGDEILYKNDLTGIVPVRTNQTDSIKIVKAYIRSWVEQRLLIDKAELNLSDEMKDVNQKLEDYRSALLIYYYEKQLVAQSLDTIVTDSEITAYYIANKKNFELKDYIVKVIYGKFDKESPKLDKARKWFAGNDKRERKLLKEYCLQYSVNYFLEDSVWLYMDDVLREVPIEIFNKEKFLKTRKHIEFEDENYIYILQLLDYKLKDSTSPISLEKDDIISAILNHRKVELIRDMKKDIYQHAIESNECEIY